LNFREKILRFFYLSHTLLDAQPAILSHNPFIFNDLQTKQQDFHDKTAYLWNSQEYEASWQSCCTCVAVGDSSDIERKILTSQEDNALNNSSKLLDNSTTQ
jgi:hypothetical protein